MGAITISMGLQKGGVGKTTTSGIVAYLLSQKQYKILAVDLDSQGNLTSLLTEKNIYDFDGRTTLEAMKEQDALKYVYEVNDYLHVLPSNDFLATLPRYLYTDYATKGNNLNYCLDETLQQAKKVYDYIIIDTPPALSENTINALCTSDYVVIVFATEKFSYDAIDRFMETVEHARDNFNNRLQVLGIVCTLIDNRRAETDSFIQAIERDYPGLRFENLVSRSASTSRVPLNGFTDNKELRLALKPYKNFLEELIERVQRNQKQ